MFASILAAALLGGIGGGVGALLGGLAEKAIRRGKPPLERKKRYGTLVGAVAGMTLANTTELRERVEHVIDPPSVTESLGQDLLSIPQLQDRLRGKSPAEVQSITQALSAAGILKLEDSYLVTRARLLDAMLTNADERLCAGFAASTLTGDDFARMMESLTDAQRKQWLELLRAAIEVEVGVRPAGAPPAPSVDRITAAIGELQSALPEDVQGRFVTDMGTLESLPPQEACWTVRTLYSGIGKTSAPTQAVIARALMMN